MRNLNILAIIILIQLIILSCSATTSTSTKNYTFNSWTGSWKFRGFKVGPSSGEYYHLLSSSTDNQCAIIKESTSDTLSWAKLYSAGECSGLAIDSSETYAYFTNTESSEFAITQINCSDGETNNHYTTSEVNITGKIDTIDASGASGYVMFGGNLQNSSGNSCSGYWDVSGTSFQYECQTSKIVFGAFAISDGYCSTNGDPSSFEITMACYNISDSSNIWRTRYNISGSGSIEKPEDGDIDKDTNNLYFAYDTVSLASIFIVTLSKTDGSFVGTPQRRVSSNSLKIGSVYATGSSIAYISSYSSNSAYAELIMYNASDFSYTIYQQTGLNLRYQFINTALSDCWYALVDTQYIHLSQLSTMSDVTGLTVASASTGLTAKSSFNSSSTTGPITLTSGTFSTTTTNTASHFNMSTPYDTSVIPQTNTTNSTNSTTTTNNTSTTTTNSTTTSNSTTTTTNSNTNNGSDDSISALAIILIIVGSIVAIVIAAIITYFFIRKCRHKRLGTHRGEMIRVESNPTEEPNVHKEENKI